MFAGFYAILAAASGRFEHAFAAVFVAAIFSLASITANAGTQQPREEIARWGQISAAAWPLAQANAELCGETTGPALGFAQVGSLDNRPMIFGIGEGSPAATATPCSAWPA